MLTSEGTFDVSNYYMSREGSTSHVDHANVFYQIPAEESGLPMVFLHGYGQSRMGWMTTPDGRPGWSDLFLRMGHSVFLIDQPRRGEAGQTSVAGTISTEPSDQTWYTQFRIGTYLDNAFTYNEGSQFPTGENVLDQFFRQMTPDTAMDSANGDQNIDCQRQFEIVRKRRRNFVVFRRGGGNKTKRFLVQKECSRFAVSGA